MASPREAPPEPTVACNWPTATLTNTSSKGGNNEVILVTDGLFTLSLQDQQRIEANRRVVLSTVGLGKDRKAMGNLRRLARKVRGSFIRKARNGHRSLAAGSKSPVPPLKETVGKR